MESLQGKEPVVDLDSQLRNCDSVVLANTLPRLRGLSNSIACHLIEEGMAHAVNAHYTSFERFDAGTMKLLSENGYPVFALVEGHKINVQEVIKQTNSTHQKPHNVTNTATERDKEEDYEVKYEKSLNNFKFELAKITTLRKLTEKEKNVIRDLRDNLKKINNYVNGYDLDSDQIDLLELFLALDLEENREEFNKAVTKLRRYLFALEAGGINSYQFEIIEVCSNLLEKINNLRIPIVTAFDDLKYGGYPRGKRVKHLEKTEVREVIAEVLRAREEIKDGNN